MFSTITLAELKNYSAKSYKIYSANTTKIMNLHLKVLKLYQFKYTHTHTLTRIHIKSNCLEKLYSTILYENIINGEGQEY